MKKLTVASIALSLFISPAAFASFHLWQIGEVYSDSTGSVQFIELFTTFAGQDFLSTHTVTSNSHSVTLLSDLVGNTANQHVLLATPGYFALSGVPAADYNLGVNNFFNTSADTINFAGVNTFTFTAGELPLDGLNSLNRAYNSAVFTTARNSPDNFAGASGTVPTPEPSTGILFGATLLLAFCAGTRYRAHRSA